MVIRIIAVIVILLLAGWVIYNVIMTGLPSAHGSSGKDAEGKSEIYINEIMAANSSAVLDDLGNNSDYIELYNDSDEDFSLYNWGLSDDPDNNIKWAFPSVSIPAKGYLLVYCSDELSYTPEALHCGFKLKAKGESVVLVDASKNVMDKVEFKDMASNMAMLRMSDGTYDISNKFSPGYPNTEEGHAEYLKSLVVQNPGIFVSEVMASNKTTLMDKDGEYSDYIELVNESAQELDLSGYYLSDAEDELQKWQIPEGTKIAAGQYLLIFASGKSSDQETRQNETQADGSEQPVGQQNETQTAPPASNELHASFRLSAYEESVIISNAKGQLLDRVDYKELGPDVALIRQPDGQYSTTTTPSPGYPNTEDGHKQYQKDHAMGAGPLILNEVLSGNTKYAQEEDGHYYDWVEIKNISGQPVQLENYALTDNPSNKARFKFPAGELQPGGLKLVMLSGVMDTNVKKKYLNTSFRLNKEGENLILCSPEGKIIDKMMIDTLPQNISYGRMDGKEGFYFFDAPTPGENNGEGHNGFTKPPAPSVQPGFYSTPQTVTLTTDQQGATIRYTTDGSMPGTGSNAVNGPITVDKTTVLRARCFKDGMMAGRTMSATYFIGMNHKIPVISLSVNPKDFFDPQTGIYMKGPNAKDVLPFDGANFFKETEVPANFEYFKDGKEVFTSEGVTRIFGAFARGEKKKSLAFIARSEYGNNRLEYPFFDALPYKDYKSIVFRQSGQDWYRTFIRDLVMTSLMGETTDLDVQSYVQCVLYLNGKYWGLYNIREKVNEHYLAQHHYIENKDSIDILVGSGKTNLSGNGSKDYLAMMDWLKTANTSQKADYDKLAQQIDVQSYTDWIISIMYFVNRDNGNIKWWRSKEIDNKWRWICYDFDWGMTPGSQTHDTVFFCINPEGTGAGHAFSTLIIRSLLKNADYKEYFLERVAYHLKNTFDPDRIMKRMDELSAVITSEVQPNIETWNSFTDTNWGQVEYRLMTPEGYKSQIEKMKQFAMERPAYFIGFIKKNMGVSDAKANELFGSSGKAPAPTKAPDTEEKEDE